MDKMLAIGNSLESWNVNSEDSLYDFILFEHKRKSR